ncbi:LATERAL ORGAN JUNCTION [Perilla frutescens var. frutescens]|nr:LATERAL ORGAN JUNCTION [Perilla frutescens var. frutescens]
MKFGLNSWLLIHNGDASLPDHSSDTSTSSLENDDGRARECWNVEDTSTSLSGRLLRRSVMQQPSLIDL